MSWINPGEKRSIDIGTVPPALAVAARTVFRRTLRFKACTDGMHWKAIAHLPLKDGSVGTHELEGLVKNFGKGTVANAMPERVAELLLADGQSFEEVGRLLGVDGSGRSNTHLVRLVKQFLMTPNSAGARVRSVALCRAILSGPPSLRRTVSGLMSGDSVFDQLHADYVSLVRETYLAAPCPDTGQSNDDGTRSYGEGWGENWIGGTNTLPRRLLAVLEMRQGTEISIPEALHELRDLDVVYNQLVALTRTTAHFGRTKPAFFARNFGMERCPAS